MEFTDVLSSLGEAVTLQAPLDVTWRPVPPSKAAPADVHGQALTLTRPRADSAGGSWSPDLTVLDSLGSGGMGSVLLARQAASVAIGRLSPSRPVSRFVPLLSSPGFPPKWSITA